MGIWMTPTSGVNPFLAEHEVVASHTTHRLPCAALVEHRSEQWAGDDKAMKAWAISIP